MTRALTLLATTLLTTVTASCTTVSAGEPRPQNRDVPAASQTATSESAPTRPHELRLDDLDPCTLIPQEDYPDFYMEKPGIRVDDNPFNAPECAWNTDTGYFAIMLVTIDGIDRWLDGSKSAKVEIVDPIAGFPAIAIVVPEVDSGCLVGVDVADDQHLLVQVGLIGSVPIDLPPICEYTHQFAASAMNTLVNS